METAKVDDGRILEGKPLHKIKTNQEYPGEDMFIIRKVYNQPL